jgi:hypothetical protein
VLFCMAGSLTKTQINCNSYDVAVRGDREPVRART